MAEDDQSVGTASPSADPVPTGTKTHRPRWVVPVGIVLVLVLIGSLVAGVWFGIRTVHGFSADRSSANALDAAKVVATRLTTFDAGTAEADTKALLATATPLYAGALEGDQDSVIKSMHANQARSSGTVTEAGVLRYDPSTDVAHVLVTVRAQVANKTIPAGQARDYRMDLTMVYLGDWLVDNVEFVG